MHLGYDARPENTAKRPYAWCGSSSCLEFRDGKWAHVCEGLVREEGQQMWTECSGIKQGGNTHGCNNPHPQNGILRIEKAYPVIQAWTVPGSACKSVLQWSRYPTLRSGWGMWGLYMHVWRGGVYTSYFVWSQQGMLPGGGDSEGTIFGTLCGKAYGHQANGSSLDLSSFPDSRIPRGDSHLSPRG